MTSNKVVLITGGTKGIGAATALFFKERGYQVASTYISNAEDAKAFEQRTGVKVFAWDASDFQQCHEGCNRVADAFGAPISILVNNAGITRDAMLHRQTLENWAAVLHNNLDSVFNMSHAVIPSMRDNNFGRIISLSSVNWHGMAGQTNYSAAKAGIVGFTKALAKESAAKGITVNAVAPGYIDTDMMKGIKPEILDSIIKTIPVQRLGQPEEIAAAIFFLAQESSGFITGSVLDINGGMVM